MMIFSAILREYVLKMPTSGGVTLQQKVILSADSTCDIGDALQEKYSVHFFNYHIQIGDKSYIDKIEISPEELYAAWREKGILPKTAAVTPTEYMAFFQQWVKATKLCMSIWAAGCRLPTKIACWRQMSWAACIR